MITNDNFQPIRAYVEKENRRTHPHAQFSAGSAGFLQRARTRRAAERAGQGRWSLIKQRIVQPATPAEWSAALGQQLLVRNGIVMRETAIAENVRGGYPPVYAALKTMEESGWIRRGMFVAGMGAAQFATPAAVDLLRTFRNPGDRIDTVQLAASDPANPYGSLLPWTTDAAGHTMSRAAGGSVVLVNGRLSAFYRRRNPELQVFLPEEEPERGQVAREVAQKLAEVAIRQQGRRSGLLISTINQQPAQDHFLGSFLEASGFVATASGFQMRRRSAAAMTSEPTEEESDEDA
jgi:ATP-dependent Lhr-like helicase